MQPRRKCTKRQLLSLIGSLSFSTKVIVPGRPFLSCLIKLSTTAHQLDHFVYLNQGIREDLVMWSHFLQGWNGRSFFLEDEFTATPDISLYTDASGVKGYGAYYQGQWFRGDWVPSQLLVQGNETSIAYHELFPIVLAACIWGHNWSQKRILFYCDNKAAVTAIDKGTSSSPLLAKLLRVLTLRSMQGNVLVRASHVPGKTNGIADALSRKQMQMQVLPSGTRGLLSANRNSRGSLTDLDALVQSYQLMVLTDNTARVYHQGARAFFNFCMHYNLPVGGGATPNGIDEQTLLYFAAHCAHHMKLAASTINLYLYGLRNW